MAIGPSNLEQLRAALASGERELRNLHLGEIDGLDLDLSDCNLQGSCFKEARFGHARLTRSQVQGCCFQQALLWGADLSELQAQDSYWHEADLSAS
ncbi:MAG: pentapeptide repeat-containing protein, partial [Synechococcaceae bacterium WB9_2_112]|nr:pentapeptide repeat-containing protein [Synechococcaceae bacterium WB9_2_112]